MSTIEIRLLICMVRIVRCKHHAERKFSYLNYELLRFMLYISISEFISLNYWSLFPANLAALLSNLSLQLNKFGSSHIGCAPTPIKFIPLNYTSSAAAILAALLSKLSHSTSELQLQLYWQLFYQICTLSTAQTQLQQYWLCSYQICPFQLTHQP